MNITYLFGAGASFHAIPTVKTLPDHMKHMAETLREHVFADPTEEKEFYNVKLDYGTMAKELADDMERLADTSKLYASIDTLAKKYMLTQKHIELSSLKAVLMAYLSLRQAQTKTDPRYDTFFASILQRHI